MVIVCEDHKWIDKFGKERKGYYLDGIAETVVNQISDRITKREQDGLIIMNGQEGSGKTNASICLAYAIADRTKRKFDVDNVFFNIDKMIEFAGSTKEQVIVWDESALGGMASEWSNFSQRKLTAMLMVCRKLRHIFFFNIPRFYKLSPNIIDRALCMFHIFEDDNETPGLFMFIGQQGLENLYNDWRRTRRANYKRYKKTNIGHFDWHMWHLIDYEEYEKRKTRAIWDLAKSEKEKKIEKIDEKSIIRERNKELAIRLRAKGKKIFEIAEYLGISERSVSRLFSDRTKGNKLNIISDNGDGSGREGEQEGSI